MKINRLDHTKSLFPHFYDKTDDSNFTKHLKVVGEPQWDIRHKLKTIEWSRILEKPLQIWKEQTEPYIYNMHFKVIVPYLKEVNVYKNPIISAEGEVIGFEKVDNPNDLDENGEQIGRAIHETFEYEDRIRLFERILSDLQSDSMIPKDNYLLEIYTWDDYHFLKGYPENDYTIKEDNILEWRYNETFLSINLEEISYSKYLTFRAHKDKIRKITIYKNDVAFITHEFDVDRIGSTYPTDFSYTYFDESITNEGTYLMGNFDSYYELEDEESNNVKIYFVDTGKDEYVFRLPLTDEDFEDGVVKDIYDLEVITFEKRYRCRQEYDRVYRKRYCGYDEQLNDCFDHDYSLDMIGRLLNVHRFRFYQVYSADVEHYSRTYPTFYDRSTEDDYHYMKRMQFYISNYNHIVFPVLEFWKYYHTMATIRSRKRIVGEMDYAYFRTAFDDCVTDYEYIDEEFESESVVEYSINKATLVQGTASLITIDEHSWYESTIVNDVYVVGDVEYHLKYEVSENSVDVTPRVICYNRQGTQLRTMPIVVDSNVENKVTDTTITIPSDTASVKIVLESNSAFSFANATFERMTVANFDNYYMSTDEDYNPNFYELYTVYEDLPSNLRIGGDRFNILFKRSLPLTKRGVFLVDILEEREDEFIADTDVSLYFHNILTSNLSGGIGSNDYENTVSDYIYGDSNYTLSYTVQSDDVNTIYRIENGTENLSDGDFTTVFSDNCISTDNNSNNYVSTTGSYSFDGTGLTIDASTYSSNNYQANLRLDDSNVYTVPFEVSFDLVNDGNDNFRLYFYNSSFSDSAIASGSLWTSPNGQTTRVRFVVTKDGITRHIGNNSVALNLSKDVAEKMGVRFGYWQPTQSQIKIKNYTVREFNNALLEYSPTVDDEELVTTKITYHVLDNEDIVDIEEEMEEQIYTNIPTHISHKFHTPTNTQSITMTISSDTDAILTDIRLSRDEKLTDEEMYHAS